MIKVRTKERIAGSMFFTAKSLVEETWVCFSNRIVAKRKIDTNVNMIVVIRL